MAEYWFKPKRYGYGATPVTWQGWAVTLGTVRAMVAVSLYLPLGRFCCSTQALSRCLPLSATARPMADGAGVGATDRRRTPPNKSGAYLNGIA